MNYELIYNNIITARQQNKPEGYSEKHHVVPRCMGGSDEEDNLVHLTAKEHFIVHRLLCKMYPDVAGLKKALWLFSNPYNLEHRHKITSRQFEVLRKNLSDSMLGKNNHMHGKTGFKHHNAKEANIYCHYTDKLIAEKVCITEWCKTNGYLQKNLMLTVNSDRSKPSKRDNRHHHKGLYARYV